MRRGEWRIAMLRTLSLGFVCLMLDFSVSPAHAELQAEQAVKYRSPYLLALSADGARLYVADRTAASVVVVDAAARQITQEIHLESEPGGLVLSPDDRWLYVAERTAGTVAVIDTTRGAVSHRIRVDQWPGALALGAGRLYVASQARHRIRIVDVTARNGANAATASTFDHADASVVGQVPVVREPSCLALTPDEKCLVATNLLPDGAATDPQLAAVVSIIDTSSLQHSTVVLPPGPQRFKASASVRTGRWAYVVHTLARFNLPITQLERGWVNTYALSIIEIAARRRVATLLLDDLTQGAASPFAVVISRDGRRLWISHAGTHEVSLVDIGKVHALLAGKIPEEVAAMRDAGQPNIWLRIQRDPAAVAELENDLTALHIAGAIRRVSSGGNGPRGLALSADDQTLYVANYYAGTVGVLERG